MTRILLLLFSCLLATSPAMAKTLNRVAAMVNNNIITTYQLDQAVLETLAKEIDKDQLTSEQYDQLRQRVLEQLINDELVAQRIKELNLQVLDQELNAAIEDVQRNNNLTREMLEKALEAQGTSFEKYREQLKKEILRYKLLSREVNYKVQVTRSEIRDYFREHIDEYRVDPKVRVSYISYDIPTDANEETLAGIRKQADISRDLLLSGEDFDKVLKAQGEATNGGDMGYLVENELAEQMRMALTGLEVGQVSEPLLMNNQLLLFLVTERNPGDINLFDRVSGEIEEKLMKMKTETRFKEWARELKEKGHIEIRL